MSSITHCPHCNTIFRVTDEQLQLCSGMVRCGICHRIFNGIDQRLDTPATFENNLSANVIERNVFAESESKTDHKIPSAQENKPSEMADTASVNEGPAVDEKGSRLGTGKINSFKVSLNVIPVSKNSLLSTETEKTAWNQEVVVPDTEETEAEEETTALEEQADETAPLSSGVSSEESMLEEPVTSETEKPVWNQEAAVLDTEETEAEEETTALEEQADETALLSSGTPSETTLSAEPVASSSFPDSHAADASVTEAFASPSEKAILKTLTEELSSISLELTDAQSDPVRSKDQSLPPEDNNAVEDSDKSLEPPVQEENGLMASYSSDFAQDEPKDSFSLPGETIPGAKEPPETLSFPISEDVPDFVKLARKKQRSGRTISILMGLICLLLLLLLSAQGIYTFSDRIIKWWPPAEPLVVQACELMSCPNRQQARISALSIESSELHAVSTNPNTYNLDLSIQNNSSSVQSWPHLELTLMDGQKKPLVRRVFTPENYLPETQNVKTGFAPHSEQTIRLYFEFQQDAAVDYRVYLFYP